MGSLTTERYLDFSAGRRFFCFCAVLLKAVLLEAVLLKAVLLEAVSLELDRLLTHFRQHEATFTSSQHN